MKTSAVIDILPPITYLAKFCFLSCGWKCCWPIKLQNSLKCNISRKKWMMKWNYKTTEYLRMKGILDSIDLRMLGRADYIRERSIFGESHVYSYGTPSVFHFGREIGWVDSLLSLAFAARWNPKHRSYGSTRLFCNSISQLCCGEQTIWDVQSYWQRKYQTNTYLGKICIYFLDINNFIYKPDTL